MRGLIFSLALAFLCSCSHFTMQRNDQPVGDQPATTHRLHYFVFGLVPAVRLPSASTLCPKGRVQAVHMFMKSSDVLLTLVTLGVYVPHRAEVTCGKAI